MLIVKDPYDNFLCVLYVDCEIDDLRWECVCMSGRGGISSSGRCGISSPQEPGDNITTAGRYGRSATATTPATACRSGRSTTAATGSAGRSAGRVAGSSPSGGRSVYGFEGEDLEFRNVRSTDGAVWFLFENLIGACFTEDMSANGPHDSVSTLLEGPEADGAFILRSNSSSHCRDS